MNDKSSMVEQQTVASALLGLGGWLLFLWLAPRSSGGLLATIENLLLFAILTIVPLACSLIAPSMGHDNHFFQWAIRLQPVAALMALCSFLLPVGPYAALLTLPWLAFAGLMGCAGLQHLRRGGLAIVYERCFVAGLVYQPIGAIWLAISRFGWRPLNFAAVIVLLTAVHFHYAGFALPTLTGLAGKWLVQHKLTWRFYRWIATGIIAGTPLLAAGITASPVIEMAGVVILFVSVVGLAWLSGIVIARQLSMHLAAWLLRISALSLLVALTFALLYGLGEYLGWPLVTLPRMVQVHGWTNAFGSIVAGLLGWKIMQFEDRMAIETRLVESLER